MKQINKLLIVLGISLALYSCQSTSNIIGTYMMKNNPHKFVFNTDSTFNYSYIVAGFEDKYSSGTWKQANRNTIELNSDIQSNIIPLKVEVVASGNKKPMINLTLIVPGKDEKEYRCTPQYAIIEGKWYVPSFDPDRGSYSYEETNYYSNKHELYFKISKEPRTIERTGPYFRKDYYVLETDHKKITTNDGDIVNVTVIASDSLFSYRVFNDTKIKFSGNKLIFKDSKDENKTSKLNIKD